MDAFDHSYQPLELLQLNDEEKKEPTPNKLIENKLKKEEEADKKDADTKAKKEDEPSKKTPDGIDGAAKKRRHDEMKLKLKASEDI